MKRTSWLVGGLVLIAAAAWAAQKEEAKPAKAPPADLSWVPTKQAMLVSVRVADLWNGELGKAVRDKIKDELKLFLGAVTQEAGLEPDQIERFSVVTRDFNSVPLFFVRSTKDLDKDKFIKRFLPAGEAKKSGDFTYYDAGLKAVMMLGDREYVIGTSGDIETLIDKRKEKTDKGLSPAVALAGKGHSIVVGVNTGEVAKADADLPVHAEPFRPFLKSEYATLAADIGTKTTGQLRLVFEKADDAKEAEQALEKAREGGLSAIDEVLKSLQKDESEGGKAIAALVGVARGAVKEGKIARSDKELTAAVEAKIDTGRAALAGLVLGQRMRTAAARMQSANNMKQLGLAMHGYHDKENALPASAVYDKNGKALLSWRVLILPYIGEQELYDKFKLDEPWDSKHNKALLEKMPKLYEMPGQKNKPGMTGYAALVGKSAIFDGKTGVSFQSITDGLSNTIMLVETDKQIPWTKPEDVEFDPDKDPPAIGGLFEGGGHALLGDGSVRFLSKDIKKENLKAMITRDGGEVIQND